MPLIYEDPAVGLEFDRSFDPYRNASEAEREALTERYTELLAAKGLSFFAAASDGLHVIPTGMRVWDAHRARWVVYPHHIEKLSWRLVYLFLDDRKMP